MTKKERQLIKDSIGYLRTLLRKDTVELEIELEESDIISAFQLCAAWDMTPNEFIEHAVETYLNKVEMDEH